MSHFRSWRDDEDGRIGLVVLFGLLGGVIGVPLGALISSVLWDVVCRVGPPGSLDPMGPGSRIGPLPSSALSASQLRLE